MFRNWADVLIYVTKLHLNYKTANCIMINAGDLVTYLLLRTQGMDFNAILEEMFYSLLGIFIYFILTPLMWLDRVTD